MVLMNCVLIATMQSAAYAQAARIPEAPVESHSSTLPAAAAGRGGTVGIAAGQLTVGGYSPAHTSTLFSSLWNASERFTGQADAGFSKFETGHLAGYGEIHTDVRLGPPSVVHVNWQTEAGGGLYRGQMSSKYLATAIRLERTGPMGRLRLTTGVGGAHDATSYGTANVELGAAVQRGGLAATGAVSLVRARSTYDDITGQLAWVPEATAVSARVQLQLSGGARLGSEVGTYKRWAATSVAVRLVRTSALVLSHGVAPSDPQRATPAAAYTSVGLRLTFGGPMRLLSLSRRLAITRAATGAVLSEASDDGTRTLAIHITAQAHVEIMADFTSWEAVPMTRSADSTWTTKVHVRTGVHHLDIRVDGGAWTPVPGLHATSDDFGGSSILLVVP